MLTLYHYWSSVCSQKARLCLAEKGLPWESRHLDLFTHDQWDPAYVRLNPKSVVPTLDHDGRIVIESNVIIAWWQAITARPAYKEAFSFANPKGNDPVKR